MEASNLATIEDVPRLVEIFQACFADEYFLQLFPHTTVGTGYQRDAWRWFVQDESAKVHVARDNEGVVAAVVLCFNQPSGQPPTPWTARWPAAREGMRADMLQEFFDGMDKQHHEVMGTSPHTYVELVFTHPSFQRRGYATQLIARVAESVGKEQPLYLDASAHAIGLYERLGFVARVGVSGCEMVPMVRPAG